MNTSKTYKYRRNRRGFVAPSTLRQNASSQPLAEGDHASLERIDPCARAPCGRIDRRRCATAAGGARRRSGVDHTDRAAALPDDYRRRVVSYRSEYPPGTIVVSTEERFLYLLLPNNLAPVS